MMNARSVVTSKPLARVLAFLQARGDTGATSRDIMEACGTVAPGTVCSELRKNGFLIRCEYEARLESGAKVFRYWIS